VNPPSDHRLGKSHSSIRMDARLDPTTRAKVDDLARRFRKPRAAVLGHIRRWGLSRGQAERLDGGESEGPVRHLYLYVDTGLHAQGEKAATAASVKSAPWLRAMVRQITTPDFPASWQDATPKDRSHDCRTAGRRFMLRLDEASRITRQGLVERFAVANAEIIRQLIIQATDEDCPTSWQMRAAERSVPPIRRRETKNTREITP
jgi:hypothetical protein